MADKRIKITQIKIKNFRSIKNETIQPSDFNIFVGLNDAGKSNVLKALNLFFNGETDYGKKYDFDRDFTLFYEKNSHRAKEIVISIKFLIPDTYQGHGEYTWSKTWKVDNVFSDEIVDSNGNKPSSNSRIPGALNRIKYRYVPAVKSREYFKTLLGDLYEAVFSSKDNPLEDSVNAFSEELKSYTSNLSSEIKKRLSINSSLSFPDDLKDIFRALIFETTNSDKEILVPLDVRGDGIQAFHIPIILKYISQEDQKSRRRGSMKVETIWGFEEPENGLELSKTFQMADDFVSYSKELQIFLSTHSPAFYLKKELTNSKVFYVSKKQSSDQTCISNTLTSNEIAGNMGLMPLVAPFIEEKSKELESIKNIVDSNAFIDMPTILVEGETDEMILKIAFEHHSNHLNDLLKNNKLRIAYKKDGAGCGRLSDWIIAWIYTGFKSKAFALFDYDDAGISAKNETENHPAFLEKQNSVQVKTKFYSPDERIIALKQKNIHLKYEVEHLLSADFWKEMNDAGLTQKRKDKEIVSIFDAHHDINKPLLDVVNDVVNDSDLVETIVLNEPKDLKKKKIVSLLTKNANIFDATKGLQNTIKELESYFK